MLSVVGTRKIYLHQESVDMRKSFESLSYLVDPIKFNDSNIFYFVFLNRRRDRLKILYWDEDGWAIWYKRLEKGTFKDKLKKELLSRKEFLIFMEGINIKSTQKRYSTGD